VKTSCYITGKTGYTRTRGRCTRARPDL